MKIDRVDRHERTGERRIIDYKTGEGGRTPHAAHHGTESIGDGSETRVSEVLNAGGTEPPPVFSMAMDAGTYYDLVAKSMMQEQDDDFPLAAREATRDILIAVGDIYDRLAFDVRFTANGGEVASSVTIAR